MSVQKSAEPEGWSRAARREVQAGLERGRMEARRLLERESLLPTGLRRSARQFRRVLPKGLYTRSLLIIVTPIVLLQAVLVFVFMERHWELVTRRLSAALSRDVAALVALYESLPHGSDPADLWRIADKQLDLRVALLPPGPLPPEAPRPFIDLLDRVLASELALRIDRPIWISTVARPATVKILVSLDDATLQVFARRSQAYASNSHIFIIWMISTAFVLIGVAILFLRNQIKPIERLARAAESFGKGREIGDFRPRGAREVRRAALAFLQMKERMERHVEQRTTMLAGVSHDLRTILTRFRLELALMGDSVVSPDLLRDVEEMQTMLEAYLAFSRGDAGETPVSTDLAELLADIRTDAERQGASLALSVDAPLVAEIRPNAFKRLVGNLVSNALRHARKVAVSASVRYGYLEIAVDDDGPGIPEGEREAVFRPFYRLDRARNQDLGCTGLGLTIARDIARGHGGDVSLHESPLGGLRAIVRVPV